MAKILFKMRNRKSISLPTEIIIGFLVLSFVAFIILVIYPRLLGKETAQASELISASGNCDVDEVADYFDKCDCLPGDEKNEGCPAGVPTIGPDAIKREEECKKICAKK